MPKMPKSEICDNCDGSGKIVIVDEDYDNPYFGSHDSESIPYSGWYEAVYDRRISCENCSGQGWIGSVNNPTQCPVCKGNGYYLKKMSGQNHYTNHRKLSKRKKPEIRECFYCKGTGKIVIMVDV